ncbi:MAG: 4-hydroxy-3-methylbut-2-enyl diphosphate reductase [Acidobacteria bacterium]|nr:4-hydroxy-3-methylbut-2-enyl diphosphate reductase [Acidobacteriota bacterium]
MKRILFLFIIILLAVTTARGAELRGVWTATSGDAGTLELTISRKNSTHSGDRWQVSSFKGLTEAQIGSVSQIPVTFRLEREAGTIVFDGVFKLREGAGHFVFTPNGRYLETLRGLGVAIDSSREESPDESLFQLAIFDVSTSFIRAMQAEGYREGTRKYIEMRIFRVTPELVREYRALGYKDIPAQQLIELQIHRATPQFVRELAAAGYKDVPLQRLVEFRIHRVTVDAIRKYHDLGYDNIPASKLVEMQIHRVTPDFIRELAAAGYAKVPIDKLVEMRIHGIDADYARRMNRK